MATAATQIGADAVINSAEDDVVAKLIELHVARRPDEIFEVTSDLVENWQTYQLIISHTIPFDNVEEALRLASTAGAADKVVVTFADG